MDLTRAGAVARLGAITNLIHGFIYFSPEASSEYDALGLDADQQYFAGRAAPMGPVPAEVVVATFFNFAPATVAAAVPAAWTVADPAAIQAARLRAVGTVLARHDMDAAAIAEAEELTGRIVSAVGYEGKPLAAANRAVAEPDDPATRLWQRVSVIREWRGDAHIAALVAGEIGAVEALILHAATGEVPVAALRSTRGWSDAEWDRGIERLVERGLVDAGGSFTDDGRRFRETLEETTNRLCIPLATAAGDGSAERLVELLRPWRRALIDGGAFARIGR